MLEKLRKEWPKSTSIQGNNSKGSDKVCTNKRLQGEIRMTCQPPTAMNALEMEIVDEQNRNLTQMHGSVINYSQPRYSRAL